MRGTELLGALQSLLDLLLGKEGLLGGLLLASLVLLLLLLMGASTTSSSSTTILPLSGSAVASSSTATPIFALALLLALVGCRLALDLDDGDAESFCPGGLLIGKFLGVDGRWSVGGSSSSSSSRPCTTWACRRRCPGRPSGASRSTPLPLPPPRPRTLASTSTRAAAAGAPPSAATAADWHHRPTGPPPPPTPSPSTSTSTRPPTCWPRICSGGRAFPSRARSASPSTWQGCTWLRRPTRPPRRPAGPSPGACPFPLPRTCAAARHIGRLK
mmetsp:Transcript_3728/g.8627  ORF Transcript_3728/g.8627 Transcript_3728/m.8627 type:complete len:272 (-) Transcript_3728:1647-2462(-)